MDLGQFRAEVLTAFQVKAKGRAHRSPSQVHILYHATSPAPEDYAKSTD